MNQRINTAYHQEGGLVNSGSFVDRANLYTIADERNRVDPNGKFYLRQIRLDAQGYTAEGEYFGNGEPLYWYGRDGSRGNYVRASNREDAKAQILQFMPSAKFCR